MIVLVVNSVLIVHRALDAKNVIVAQIVKIVMSQLAVIIVVVVNI